MGCIRVNIEASKGIKVSTFPLSGINVSVNPSRSIKVSVGVVCDVGQEKYVKVTPKHIWLTPDNDYTSDVDIMSNTVWTIIQTE